MGSRFEELREIIDRVALSDKLGVCLDTCHVSDAGYDIAEDLDGVLAEFDRVVSVSDRATAYNVMAHTDCVSTGSGVLPDGYGDDRLMTLPLIGGVPDMRLGVIRPRDVPLTPHGQQFVDILQHTLSELTGE